jgi:hypothetical protein
MKDPFLVHGPLKGPCSICGAQDSLTVDHVPPKGATRISAMEMRDLMDRLSVSGSKGRHELSQDGVKFRSLCRICNNERLGAQCDPELIRLCNHADGVLRSRLILPATFAVDVRPMRVLRALVGHLLATQSGRRPVGPFEEGLASFFLDLRLPPPRELECFYWIYPFNDQVIVRDAALTRLGHGIAPLVFKLIKFYPLAFLLTWERHETSWPYQMPQLTRFRDLSNDEAVPMTIDLRVKLPQRWPEAPTGDGAVLYGGRPMHANPREFKSKKQLKKTK